MITSHLINHYNTVIFNPIGQTINSNIIPTNINYYYRGKKRGKFVEF